MRKIRVGVMNTSEEITDMLQAVLVEEGFETCRTFTYDIKRGKTQFDDFVEINKPDVIVYDVAIPYKENYKLFQEIEKQGAFYGIPFVLTSTNKLVLEKIVEKTKTHELIGKPFDLAEITASINRAYKSKKKA